MPSMRNLVTIKCLHPHQHRHWTTFIRKRTQLRDFVYSNSISSQWYNLNPVLRGKLFQSVYFLNKLLRLVHVPHTKHCGAGWLSKELWVNSTWIGKRGCKFAHYSERIIMPPTIIISPLFAASVNNKFTTVALNYHTPLSGSLLLWLCNWINCFKDLAINYSYPTSPDFNIKLSYRPHKNNNNNNYPMNYCNFIYNSNNHWFLHLSPLERSSFAQ